MITTSEGQIRLENAFPHDRFGRIRLFNLAAIAAGSLGAGAGSLISSATGNALIEPAVSFVATNLLGPQAGTWVSSMSGGDLVGAAVGFVAVSGLVRTALDNPFPYRTYRGGFAGDGQLEYVEARRGGQMPGDPSGRTFGSRQPSAHISVVKAINHTAAQWSCTLGGGAYAGWTLAAQAFQTTLQPGVLGHALAIAAAAVAGGAGIALGAYGGWLASIPVREATLGLTTVPMALVDTARLLLTAAAPKRNTQHNKKAAFLANG